MDISKMEHVSKEKGEQGNTVVSVEIRATAQKKYYGLGHNTIFKGYIE